MSQSDASSCGSLHNSENLPVEDAISIGTATDDEEDKVIADFHYTCDNMDSVSTVDKCDVDDDDEHDDHLVCNLKVPETLQSQRKDGFTWNRNMPKSAVLNAKRNILFHVADNKQEAINITDKHAVSELFFPSPIIDLILKFTNEKINEENEK